MRRIITWFLLALSAFLLVVTGYKSMMFGNAQIDELLFYLSNNMTGVHFDTFTDAFLIAIPIVAALTILLGLPMIPWVRKFVGMGLAKIPWPKKLLWFKTPKGCVLDRATAGGSVAAASTMTAPETRAQHRWGLLALALYPVLVFLISVTLLLNSFQVGQYLRALWDPGQLFEEHYVDPGSVRLDFPEKPRNLIYVFLESVENTVMSKENGGVVKKSLMPELEALALDPENVSFTGRPGKLGGALQVRGTGWSLAGISAQYGGVPVLNAGMENRNRRDGNLKQFLPGAIMLGDILKQRGYNQTFIEAANADFGGMRALLNQHGDYNILDIKSLKEQKRLPEHYQVFWGFEDKKLFQFGREEALRLSKADQPFSLTLFTADTHYMDGWLDPSCGTPFATQYENVHACSSRMAADFIKWVQEQPFAGNTTIIVTGDHLGMNTHFYSLIGAKPDYERSVYNLIINPAVRPEGPEKRLFATMDMYPTILASIGVKVEGDRLGLGTNLFSPKQTLMEELGGFKEFDEQLGKRSAFYHSNILRLNGE